MKAKRILSLTLALVLVATLTLTTAIPVFATSIETESNNTMSSADTIYNGDTFVGTVTSSGDKDYLKFTVSKRSSVVISVVPTNSTLSMKLYDANGSYITSASGSSSGMKIINTTVSSGTYYLLFSCSSWCDYQCSIAIKGLSVPATSISLNKDTLELYEGESGTLTASVLPSNTTDSVTWKSSDTSVATVNSSGKVTAVAPGNATITATAGSYRDTCAVYVKPSIPATSISLNKEVLELHKGASETLSATVLPSNTTDSITWKSSDSSVVTVDSNGKVTAVDLGSAMITATAGSYTVSCTVNVLKAGKYELTDAAGTDGSEVDVYVSVADNPGIISLRSTISFDTAALDLIAVQDCELLQGWTTPSETLTSPYIIRWVDPLVSTNNLLNGQIVKLTFRIKQNSPVGDYAICVNHVEARDVNGAKILFSEAKAKIHVFDYIIGDADGDDEITDWDGILLSRYLAGWSVDIENIKAMDTDGDGEITDWDSILLDRYLAGWAIDSEIGK